MTDIVERLRNGANDPMWANHSEFPKCYLAEAADEIERLRARIVKKDEALKPFAEAAESGIDIDDDGGWSAWEQPCSMDVTVDDFRKTVTALALTPDDRKEPSE